MAKTVNYAPGTKPGKVPALMLAMAAILFLLWQMWGDGLFSSTSGYFISAVGTAAAVLYLFHRVTNGRLPSNVIPFRRKLGWFRKTLCVIFFALGTFFLLGCGGALTHGDLAVAVGSGIVSVVMFIMALVILFKRS